MKDKLLLGCIVVLSGFIIYASGNEPITIQVGHPHVGNDYTGDIVDVHDGDTVKVKDKYGELHKIRMAYIDAPELKQLYGEEAKFPLIVYKDQSVKVKVNSRDLYGREVAELFFEGKSLNLEQIQYGSAWVYDKYLDKNHKVIYEKAEQLAMENKVGLWGYEYEKPCKFRGTCK